MAEETKRFLAGLRTPQLIDVEITAHCNLRCKYCYFFDNDGVRYEEVPTEDWLAFFDEAGSLGVMEICLAGGEPFVRKDFLRILDRIVENRMRFSILSNGGMITEESAAHIAATGRCNAVQVSIDGPSASIHDASRGEGSFDAAVRGVRLLQKYHVPVTSRVTITKYNVHHLDDTASFLLEELGLNGFGTNSAGYLGSCRKDADSTLLSVEEHTLAMQSLVRLNRKYSNRISANAGPLADARMWRRMEEARRSGAPAFPNGGFLTGCGCPSTKMAVRADGSLVPCSLLPQVLMGQINTDSLLEVWQRAPALTALRQRHSIDMGTFDKCSSCEYRPYCTGNCPALAVSLTGELDRPSPDGCVREYLERGGSIDWLFEEHD